MNSTMQLQLQAAEGFRLSPQQRKVWRLMERLPHLSFAAQCTVRIMGLLNAGRLDQAVLSVRRSHEILRTRFALLQGASVPVQVIGEEAAGLNQRLDRRSLNATGAAEQLERIAGRLREQAARPGEASGETSGETPGVDFTLIDFSWSEHVLLVTASALCADASSLHAIAGEVRDAYAGTAENGEQLQYADIAEWQNQLLEEDTEAHDRYWKSAEFSALRFPHLPFERRGFSSTTERGAFHRGGLAREFSRNIAVCLRAAEYQSGASCEAVLLAAFQLLINRLTGMEQFLIGVGVDGRMPAELRNAIGLFAKSMPVAAIVEPQQTFLELLQKVHKTLEMAKYDHAYLDGESSATQQDSRPAHPIIFSTRERPALDPVGLVEWRVQSSDDLLEPFELAVTAVISGGCLEAVKFAWDKSLFSEYEIAMIASFYMNILVQVASNPGRPLGDFCLDADAMVPLLTTDDARQKLPCGVHEWIGYQCERAPDRVAVICEHQQINYGELNRRATALAGRLQKLGAGPDRVVAIVAQRSIDFIAGILAVLKSGAAWLPVDPETPAARIEYMLKQARAIAALAESGTKAVVEKLQIPMVELDNPGQEAAGFVAGRVAPEQLAYVIFTSGSTGEPKGVAIEHRQLMAYIQGFRAEVNLPDDASYALVSTMAADLGHTPIFAALASGGCVHVVPPARSSDMAALGRYFMETRVHCVKIVPAHLEALCRALPETAKLPWSAAIVGGEPLTWELAQLARKLAPGCTVLNEYGPTETTVGVICAAAEPHKEKFNTVEAPIGRPRPGVSAYVLDQQLRQLPAWIAGDLYIGGNCVGRGYIGSSGVTAERFVPDPFHPAPGARMYKTGDRARYRTDGTFEFLGRSDGQIKLRGYRIELGEIEAVLSRHPKVQGAVAMLVQNGEEKYLAAWAAVGQAEVQPQELRRFAMESLPGYMVPNVFTCVDRFKLTGNGKIDRQALPPAVEQRQTRARSPIDELEESLMAVWRKVLGRENVSVEDNYFALGGDSLRVVQVVHEARRYGIRIRAMDILRHQTIRNLRKALQQERCGELFPNGIPQSAPTWPQELGPLPADAADFYPVTGIQNFVLQQYARNTEDGIFHIQECFELEDDSYSREALEGAFRAVVERHPALRTVFYLGSATPMQCVRRALPWQMTFKDISGLESSAQEDCIEQEIHADRIKSFDTANPDSPLFRVSVLLRGAGKFNLLFSCHHAIMDGWGHRTLLNELVEMYERTKCGEAPKLGEPDHTCREFAGFEKAIGQSGQAAQFWRSYLAGARLPRLPNRTDSAAKAPEDRALRAEFTPEQTKGLWQAATQQAVSMQALLLAAWLQALREWSGEAVVSAGVVCNGRSEYLTDPLSAVGLFWNIVPCITRWKLPLPQQAAMVQKELTEIQPYSAYPLLQLIAENGGQELFYSAFKYLNFWNTKDIPENSGLRLKNARTFDRYPFAISCSAVLSPAGGNVEIEYNPKAVSAAPVKELLSIYRGLLDEVARKKTQNKSNNPGG
jgi:amino acid adenylation domain-containing protein